jgi:hypothetical protein
MRMQIEASAFEAPNCRKRLNLVLVQGQNIAILLVKNALRATAFRNGSMMRALFFVVRRARDTK